MNELESSTVPASERKRDVLRFSSVQYILVLHFQISQSNHPNCNSKLLKKIKNIYKSIIKILLHASNSKLNKKIIVVPRERGTGEPLRAVGRER
jgi:hypothetical protein